MTPIGIDTSFLVAVEAAGHEHGFLARELLARLLADKESFAINPDVLSEFIHAITDPKRMDDPLTVPEALERAKYWWTTPDVLRAFPTTSSTNLFLDWFKQYRLGRKRLRDTMLAASYFSAGVTRIVMLNAKDFRVFGCFEIIEPPQISMPT